MPICNILEYGSNYSITAGSLWFYYKDEGTSFDADIADTRDFKYFKHRAIYIYIYIYIYIFVWYKTKLIRGTWRTIKNCQQVLVKNLKDQCIAINIKKL